MMSFWYSYTYHPYKPSKFVTEKLLRIRARTGLGWSKCKEILIKFNGNIEEALNHVRLYYGPR